MFYIGNMRVSNQSNKHNPTLIYYYPLCQTFVAQEYDELQDVAIQTAPLIAPRIAAYLNLARVYAAESNWDKALATCHEAKGTQPHAIVYQVLSSIYYAMGKSDDAIEHLRRALECEPDDVTIVQFLEMLSNQ